MIIGKGKEALSATYAILGSGTTFRLECESLESNFFSFSNVSCLVFSEEAFTGTGSLFFTGEDGKKGDAYAILFSVPGVGIAPIQPPDIFCKDLPSPLAPIAEL